MENGISCKWKSKESQRIKLIQNRLQKKTVTRDKKEHYIVIKGLIQEDIKIANTYAPNIGAPKSIKQILTDTKGETDSNTIIVGDFNTPLTSIDHPDKKSIRKHWP